MAFNGREQKFLEDMQNACAQMISLYPQWFTLKESFDEEFAAGQDNALDDHTTELAAMGLSYADVAAAVNQAGNAFLNFWIGEDVTTREYGKDARRVAK